MRGRDDDFASLSTLNSIHDNAREGNRAANTLGDPFNLNFSLDSRTGLVCDVDVQAHAGAGAEVVGCNRHAAHPVNDGSRYGAMNAALAVHMDFGKGQACKHIVFVGGSDLSSRMSRVSPLAFAKPTTLPRQLPLTASPSRKKAVALRGTYLRV